MRLQKRAVKLRCPYQVSAMDYQVHESSYVDENVIIGTDTKIWHFCHIIGGSRIGKECSLGQNCVVGPNAILGNNVKVQNNISIYEGVECEDDVFLGPSMVFTNVINPRSHVIRKSEYKKTLVKKGASIGANVTVICGNVIGQYALVGAGALVNKNVPDFALMIGVPAKQIGWIDVYGERLEFDDRGYATDCEGREYQLQHNNVILINEYS